MSKHSNHYAKQMHWACMTTDHYYCRKWIDELGNRDRQVHVDMNTCTTRIGLGKKLYMSDWRQLTAIMHKKISVPDLNFLNSLTWRSTISSIA
jgi:hypothetical protein